MAWNRNDPYSFGDLTLETKTTMDELGYYNKANLVSDKTAIETAARDEGRLKQQKSSQNKQAAASAAMSALGLLSVNGIAKRAKRQVEATYKGNIRALDLSQSKGESEIRIAEAGGRKNIFTTMAQQAGSVKTALISDPRVLSTSKMSEAQGAEGRIAQSASLALSQNKLASDAAKGELDLRTIISKGNQEVERYRQKQAIEGQKSAAIRKGVTDIAMAAAGAV